MNIRHVCGIKALALATFAAFGIGTSVDVQAGQVYADALQSGQSFDQFIVKYRSDSVFAGSSRAAAAGVADLARLTGQTLQHERRLAVGGEVVKLAGRALNAEAARKFMAKLAEDPNVEYVEPDARFYPVFTPNDTRYSEQWHYLGAPGGLNLPAAWDIATGSGVVVAVIDTGITSHADLSANVVAGYDFISSSATARDGNGRDSNPQDQGDWTTSADGCGVSNSSWHGTHVAGTIAAVTNNASGVAGVAFNAKVQPVRVLGKCGGTLSDIADAIVWASGGTVSGIPANPTPAKVINMSLGGSGSCTATYQNAINSAVGRGTVVAVAAGNSNADAANFSPSSCTGVIAVAALDKEGNRASYSNFGAVVDIAAPGGETATLSKGVLSTLNSGTTTPGSASYQFYQGTSMATPHIAGLAALMLSKNPALTPAQVESTMKANVRAITGTCSGGCGAGAADATRVLQAMNGSTPPPPPPSGSTLSNGVAVTGLAAATGAELNFTMVVPSGASNLKFVISGGTGDADLYVKFGSAPTDSVYDCRPFLNGNAETCNIATAQAGTYFVRIKAFSTFSGVSLTGSYSTTTVGPFFQNTTVFNIADFATINSPITVTGVAGNAPSTLKVSVNITHTYQGDLKVDLVAPDGTLYNIHNRSGGSADNVIKTVTINASSEVANGTWNLRVNDNAAGDIGKLNSWSMQF